MDLFKLQYSTADSGFQDWIDFRKYDNVEEALRELEESVESHQYLSHRLVRIEMIEHPIPMFCIAPTAPSLRTEENDYDF